VRAAARGLRRNVIVVAHCGGKTIRCDLRLLGTGKIDPVSDNQYLISARGEK
jgi:hypothetical protein